MQCYEIMNDLGANVATILDHNQMSYSNMAEYMDLGRTERFHQESEKATFDISNVKSKDPRDKDFSGAWGQGIKMNWAYVPKEEQKCHINWRQSINDDGSNMKRLASFPCSYANGAGNAVGKKSLGGEGGMMPRQKEAMDAFSGEQKGPLSKKAEELISNGEGCEGQKADLLNVYREEAEKERKHKASEAGLDPLLMTCVGFVTKESDFDALIAKYQDLKTNIGTDNPAVLVSAYGTSEKVFLGTRGATDNEGKPVDGNKLPQDGIPRFDQPFPSTKNDGSGSGSGSGGSGGSGGDSDEEDEDSKVKVNWADIDSWLWAEFAPRFVNRAEKLGFSSKDMDLFPKVCYLYCVVIPELKNSRYDTDEYAFPFTDEEIALGMRYSGKFGEQRDGGSRIHRGIDIGADRGIKIHAIADGTVTAAGDGWGEACNAVNIQHANGVYSRYLHCNEVLVSTGQQVTKGQEVATVGGTGSSGPDTYDDHLHLEICHGESEATYSDEDPASFFPLFQSEVPYGEWLKASQ